MFVVTYFFTINEIKAQKTAVQNQMSRIAKNIATMQLLDRQEWDVYQNYISQLMQYNEDIVYIAIFDDRNMLRAHTVNLGLIELEQPIRSRLEQANLVRQLDNGAIAAESQGDLITHPVNIQLGDRILGSVHVGFSIIEINQDLNDGIRLNIALSILFLIIFNGLAIYISRRLTYPLEKLSKAMEAVNQGNLNQSVQAQSNDEIAELSRAFNEMVEGLRERRIIDKLGNELSAAFQINNLGALVRERMKSAVEAAAARLYIRDHENKQIFNEITLEHEQRKNYPSMHISNKISKYLYENSKGFMIQSAPAFVRKALQYKHNDEGGLVVAMQVKDQLLGLLFLELPANQDTFLEKQRHFALTLANQAAIALENSLLYEELREQERFKRELEIARDVQSKLLPSIMPQIKGYQIEAFCQPAREVGGDYFDFFHLDRNHLGIAIADVCGKGTSASFYMAQIKGMMLQLTSHMSPPKELLTELNQKLYQTLEKNAFITMLYGILNIPEKKLTFARAGHNGILKLDLNGAHKFLVPDGIGLGLEKGDIFKKYLVEDSVYINPKETVLFYTDGIVETMNAKQETLGEERFLRLVKAKANENVLQIKQEILEALKKFMGDFPQHDDIAMIILRCDDTKQGENK
jgi:serine phosphatase RsbU (regulator of sigma subunit)/HAMP domain-containing protein